LRIYLDNDDCPDPGDRETAARIIEEIATNDVFTRGSFVLEGYSAARRIAQALTAARADERRRGFETPFRMRPIKPALGAPAVLANWAGLRPLHHWQTIEGVRFQSYRAGIHSLPLISDDAKIRIERSGAIFMRYVVLVRSTRSLRDFALFEFKDAGTARSTRKSSFTR
jgi:hypothetical protein